MSTKLIDFGFDDAVECTDIRGQRVDMVSDCVGSEADVCPGLPGAKRIGRPWGSGTRGNVAGACQFVHAIT